MQLIGSIKIIHDEQIGGPYRLLADYFRIIGAYVCDCTMKEDQTDTDFDTVIVITKNINEEILEQIKKNYSTKSNLIELHEIDFEKENKTKYLNDCIEKIAHNSKLDNKTAIEEEVKQLQKLAEIYVNNELMKARCSFAYLYHRREVVEDAQKRFLKAYVDLVKYIKEQNGLSKYLMFARIDLARFVDETCVFLSQELIFDVKKLIEYARQIQGQYNFSNLYILQGLLAELDKRYQREAKKYYESAVEIIKDKTYASYAYYRLERFCENVEGNWEEAFGFYKKSNQANPYEYCALYKMAVYKNNKKNYSEAIIYLQRICAILSKKEEMNYLQEKEYEYLYKSYYLLASIYDVTGNDKPAQEYYEKIISLNKQTTEENKIYQQIYGEDAIDYGKYTKEKIKLKTIYQKLSFVYERLGESGKGQQMWEQSINS